eukprot:6207279-Pleurochrysis_carterae.AAC.1
MSVTRYLNAFGLFQTGKSATIMCKLMDVVQILHIGAFEAKMPSTSISDPVSYHGSMHGIQS